jgi:hypothetical protein
MSGCSLTDAFPDITDKSGKIARKEERKKAKTCGGPALSFLKAAYAEGNEGNESEDPDPDRMAKRPDQAPLAMSKQKENFLSPSDFKPLQEKPGACPDDSSKLIGQHVKDVIGEKSRNSLPRATQGQAQQGSTSYGDSVPSYFGKSGDDVSGYADFNPALNDNPGYQIAGAGFGSFDKKGLEKATGEKIMPTPALNNVWKPLTPGGAQTSFFDAHYGHASKTDDSFSREEKEALLKKLDVLFARLDDLENKKNEYAHTEVSLFILSGLFLLFGMETLRKFR